MAGYVVHERDVEAVTGREDGALVRATIGPEHGCARLRQETVRYGPGRSGSRDLAGEQAVVYVASGRGRLLVGEDVVDLEPDTGAYVADGETYAVENTGDGELVTVVVTTPRDRSTGPSGQRSVRYADQPALPATAGREFRHLVDHEVGSHDVTQFVGVIPPGRAPFHSHVYDEVIYVVDGEGVLHLGDGDTPIAAGTCIHLPPLVEHCLENTGSEPMRVLGVFHPAGDPASRAYDAGDPQAEPTAGDG